MNAIELHGEFHGEFHGELHGELHGRGIAAPHGPDARGSTTRSHGQQRPAPLIALLAATLLIATGCGGGGGSGTGSSSPTAQPPAATQNITGSVIKGTVRNAVVTIFPVNAGSVATTALGSGITDSAGHFMISVPADRTGPTIIEVTAQPAGAAVATTMVCDYPAGCGRSASAVSFGSSIALAPGFRLRAAVADIAVANSHNVSFFTDLAAAKAMAQSNLTATVIQQSNDSVRDLFGLSEDITRINGADVAQTPDVSQLSAPQRRAALLSAGAMGALIGDAADAGPALSAALDRTRASFVAEGGQLIANEGELNDSAVSYGEILASALRAADDPRVTAGPVTELRAEAERVAQLPVGQRTDGMASPGYADTERQRAVAFVNDVRNAVTAFGDPEFADEIAPKAVRDALDAVAADAADTAQPLSTVAMAVVDAVQRFRAGAASPIVIDGVSVSLANEAGTDQTTFAVDHTADEWHVVMAGRTKGALSDLEVVDNLKSTEVELAITATLTAPGISGQITNGTVRAHYSELLKATTVGELVQQLPGVVVLPQIAAAQLIDRNTALASLHLQLNLKLQQAAAPEIDPLALEANLTIDGTDLARFHQDTTTPFACPDYANAVFALSRCFVGDNQGGLRFDALRLAMGATATSAAGRVYRVGLSADLQGAGTHFVTSDTTYQTAIVSVPNLSTAIRVFGPVTGAQGTQFCCFVPADAPLAAALAKGPEGLVESADAFVRGGITVSLETNAAPLSPRSVFTATVQRDTFAAAASDLVLEFGGRTLRAHATTDTLQDGKAAVVNLDMTSQDGARFAGRYDVAT